MGAQGTVKGWRRDILRIARDGRREGVERFEWLTARDDLVCPKCHARDGRVFTFAELEAELEGKFCAPGDADDRCRCTVLPAFAAASERPRAAPGIHASHSAGLLRRLVGLARRLIRGAS